MSVGPTVLSVFIVSPASTQYGEICSAYFGCHFPTKKLFRGIRNKTEQTAVLSEFRLFCGREKPRNSAPNYFSEEKNPRNSVPNYFSEDKNPSNSILNHFSEEKNPRNSVPNNFWMRKTSEFCSELFSEEKKPWNSVPNHFRKRKNLGKTTFVSCFVKPNYFRGFRFVPSYGMDSSEILGMSTLFRRITKTIPSLFCGIFSEQNFDGNPTAYPGSLLMLQ
jgi:hypothetical protein